MYQGEMDQMNINVELKHDMVFQGNDERGLSITMDASPEASGQDAGTTPMNLILMALGGCSSMDIMSILRRIRDKIEKYNVKIEGKQNSKHPKVFNQIHLSYFFWGRDIPEEDIKKAVALSLERYCPVNAILAKSAEITYDIILNDKNL